MESNAVVGSISFGRSPNSPPYPRAERVMRLAALEKLVEKLEAENAALRSFLAEERQRYDDLAAHLDF